MTRKLLPLAAAVLLAAAPGPAQAKKWGKGKAKARVMVNGVDLGGLRLGVEVVDLTDDLQKLYGAGDAGVLVGTVEADSPAAKAGVKVGDVLVEVDGAQVESSFDVLTELADGKAGDQVKLVVVRDKKRVELSATLDDAWSSGGAWGVQVGGGNWGAWGGGAGGAHVFSFDASDHEEKIEKMERRMKELEERLEKLEKKTK
jgi:C-terminal processing protease CtpA/Prc